MTDIRRVESTTPWTEKVGYSRAIRIGNEVRVGGTTGVTEDGIPVIGGPYAQAQQAIANIAHALSLAGATLEDVVQTRMYVTDISLWEEIGRAHGEAFGEVLTICTMVEVSGLIDPRLLVEIEAVAYAPA